MKTIKTLLSKLLTIKSKVGIFAFIFCLSFFVFNNINNAYAQKTVDGAPDGIVICGRGYDVKGTDVNKPCTIDDIFKQANNLAGFILKVIFPVIFFFGLFMIAWPLVNQMGGGANPASIALAKKRGGYLVVGTVFTVGAFLIIKALLSSLGYKETDTIQVPVNSNANTSYLFVERVYAEGAGPLGFLPNPLADISVQKATLGVANVFAYIIIVCAILGIVRGVMYLLLTQQDPGNIEKGKKWILGSLAAAALIFGAQLFYSIIVDTASSVLK